MLLNMNYISSSREFQTEHQNEWLNKAERAFHTFTYAYNRTHLHAVIFLGIPLLQYVAHNILYSYDHHKVNQVA